MQIIITESDRRIFRAEAKRLVPLMTRGWRLYPRYIREAALDSYVRLKCKELQASAPSDD